MDSSKLWRRAALRIAGCGILVAGLAACGGGGSGSAPPPAPVPPVITQQPASLSIASGQTATFSVTVADSPGASFQWLRDGAPIAGETQAATALAGARMADSGSRWSVRVANSAGVVTSAEALLTVSAPPTPLGISLVASGVGDVFGIVADAQGNTIVARSESFGQAHRMVARKFAPDGSMLPFGPGGAGVVLPGSYAAGFYPPTFTGLALDADGVMYASTVVAGSAGINSFPAIGGSLWRITPAGETTRIADWPANSAGAMAPAAIAAGPGGALYFVDYISGHLVKWTNAGASAVQPRLRFPGINLFSQGRDTFITVDSHSTVHVLYGYVLRKVVDNALVLVAGNPDSPFAGIVQPQGVPGTPGTSDGQGRAATFFRPVGMAADAAGNLYVADDEVVRKVTPDGTVTTVAGQRGATTLATGPLPGSPGRLESLAIGPDGVLQAVTHPMGFLPDLSLVKIRLP